MLVEQQRIFERAARKESFSQSRQEDGVESAPACLVDGADEYVAVAPFRRVRAEKTQFFPKHVVHFVEAPRAAFPPWLPLPPNPEHGFRAAQRPPGEIRETIEPC